jgi:hypothetical protein
VKCAAALLIAAALALGSAGCGGGGNGRLSRSEYQATMGSIVRQLDSALSHLGSFSPTDLEAVDTYFKRLGGTFDRLQGELEQIKPPKDVQALHGRLTDAAGKAAGVLQALARRLKRASPADRQRILTSHDASTERLLSALNGVERAANALAAKGYRFRAG